MLSVVDNLRLEVAEFLKIDAAIDVGEVRAGECSTCIRAYLLHAWLLRARDPAAHLAAWLWNGAPAGITADFAELDGLFPRVPETEPELDASELGTDYSTFVNYDGVEDDPDVAKALDAYRDSGYFAELSSVEAAKEYLGADFVLSRIGAVSKNRKQTRSPGKRQCRDTLS